MVVVCVFVCLWMNVNVFFSIGVLLCSGCDIVSRIVKWLMFGYSVICVDLLVFFSVVFSEWVLCGYMILLVVFCISSIGGLLLLMKCIGCEFSCVVWVGLNMLMKLGFFSGRKLYGLARLMKLCSWFGFMFIVCS